AAAGTAVDTRLMVIVIATGEGPLGAALAGHGEGFRVEQLAPLFFGFFHALDHYPALPGRLARLYTRPRLPFGSAAVFWYFMPPLPPPLMRPQTSAPLRRTDG